MGIKISRRFKQKFRAILGFVKTNINKSFDRVELRVDDGGLINKQEIHCYRS